MCTGPADCFTHTNDKLRVTANLYAISLIDPDKLQTSTCPGLVPAAHPLPLSSSTTIHLPEPAQGLRNCQFRFFCIVLYILYIMAPATGANTRKRVAAAAALHAANDAKLAAALQAGLAAGLASQPANTAKAYRKPQRDWKVSTSPIVGLQS